MEWHLASDLQIEVEKLVSKLKLFYIDPKRMIVFRSFGSRSRAQARIWGLPRIWQKALKTFPHYCLEVLSEKFDRLSKDNQQKILIHELLHIPKNFSGSLLPHQSRGRRINSLAIEKLFKKLKK